MKKVPEIMKLGGWTNEPVKQNEDVIGTVRIVISCMVNLPWLSNTSWGLNSGSQ